MRVAPPPLDERGAVVVLVAILLVVLFGMVVLVIDVGSLLVLKGRMGTAADSASLAAAQSCAVEQGDVAAQAEANEVALGNLGGVPGAESNSFVPSPSCAEPSGSVSVSYSGEQSMYFAPVLGFDAVATVGDSASAMWGPATIAEPIPIVLNSDCKSRCSYWYEPDPENGIERDDTFGFVDLAAWRTLRGQQAPRCRNSSNALPNWIRGIQVIEVPLGQPPASACPIAGSGDWEDAIVEQYGLSRSLVINNSDQMVAGQYAAMGFVPLVVESLTAPTFFDVEEVCATVTIEHLEPDQVVPLTLDVLACLLEYGLTADIRLRVFPEDLDWIFEEDPDTPLYLFTWLDEAADNVRIEIVVTVQEADGGECAPPVPSEDSRCLTVTYEGPKVGGREPDGSAPDFGLRAIRLTRLTGDE